jgi:hypothetical protein
MMFGEPHLVVNGPCSGATGNEARQLQIIFRKYLPQVFNVLCECWILLPLFPIQVNFLEHGFMPPEKILWIVDGNGVIGLFRKDDGGPAGTGEAAESLAQSVDDVEEA